MMSPRKRLTCLLVLILSMLVACGPGDGPVSGTAEPPSDAVEAESSRDGVFTIGADGQRRILPSPQETLLGVGEGVDVDADGRAILRFADLLTVEVLRDGGLTLQELSADEQSAFVSVLQNGGALINDFNAEEEIDRRFTVQTEFAEVTAIGSKFLVVREANTPLEWVVGLDSIEKEGDVMVSASGEAKHIMNGLARWVAPVGPPSAGIEADMGSVEEWIASARRGALQPEIGEILWSPADVIASTGSLTRLPETGQPFELGGVELTLDPQGLFGNPTYGLADCNDDGIRDITMQAGRLHMDFRQLTSRVRALDVTVINRGQANSGSLQVLDPGEEEINRVQLTVGPGEAEILSLRSEPGQPYHYAELAMGNGCFLGFSLTPPLASGDPGPPRSAVDSVLPEGGVEVPTPETPLCTVTSPALNLRDGPGLVYAPPLQALQNGAQLEPLTQSPDGEWIEVRVQATGQRGWVSADSQFVSCNIDPAALPVAETLPATPTPKSYSAPVLAEPTHETTTYQLPVTLKWKWDGTLGPNEYFDVRVWFGGQAKVGIGLTKEPVFRIEASHPIWRFGPGWYHWKIVVVEARNGQVARELSPHSQERAFRWVRGQPDLVVRKLEDPEIVYSQSGYEMNMTFTVANVGESPAGAFDVVVTAETGEELQTVRVDGLAPGEAKTVTKTMSLPSGNCFNPDCTICIILDSGQDVGESNEGNNRECTVIVG